jgi:tetratricopeptide (TPR) repeat protein
MRFVFLVLFCLGPAVLAAPPCTSVDPSAEARQQLESHHYPAALALYQSLLQRSPDDPGVLMNAAYAAQGAGQLPLAVRYLEHAHQVAPRDWHVEERLVLAYQAQGKAPEAEELVTDLVKRWNAKDDPTLSATEHFLRDQFTADKNQYDVYQWFSPETARSNLLYEFLLVDPQGGKPQMIYFVSQNKLNHKWEFSMMSRSNQSAYYGSSDAQPKYTDALRVFAKVWDGRIKAASRAIPTPAPTISNGP